MCQEILDNHESFGDNKSFVNGGLSSNITSFIEQFPVKIFKISYLWKNRQNLLIIL